MKIIFGMCHPPDKKGWTKPNDPRVVVVVVVVMLVDAEAVEGGEPVRVERRKKKPTGMLETKISNEKVPRVVAVTVMSKDKKGGRLWDKINENVDLPLKSTTPNHPQQYHLPYKKVVHL